MWVKEEEIFILKETITPKRLAQGLTPQSRKWKDTKAVRNQIWWRWWMGNDSRPPHRYKAGLTRGGVIWSSIGDKPIKYDANGWSRARSGRKLRNFNGYQEWGADRDAWAKRPVLGKSSRARMKMEKEWFEEAYESLRG